MGISTSPPAERIRSPVGAAVWALATATIVAVSIVAVLVSRSSVLHARGIEVTGGSHLSRAEIVRAAGVSMRTNVLWLDEATAESRLEAQPWIADASVHVAFPWTIRIDVVERVPVAVVTDGERVTLVADDGTSLGPAMRAGGLPRIELSPPVDGSRPSARGAAAAIGAMPTALRGQLASVTLEVDGSIDLRLRGGIAVRYGSATEPSRKALALARILSWAVSQGSRVVAVNVVAPDLPAVRFAAA